MTRREKKRIKQAVAARDPECRTWRDLLLVHLRDGWSVVDRKTGVERWTQLWGDPRRVLLTEREARRAGAKIGASLRRFFEAFGVSPEPWQVHVLVRSLTRNGQVTAPNGQGRTDPDTSETARPSETK